MIINNNRIFFPDPITKGWTKKDWALNLIPLGGIASVAYEIGSACLSSRDRTAKISKDFFKSLNQISHKKIAQCLWVPIVISGTLKLICLIVNACLNRCFPPSKSKDSCAIVPPDVFINNIFPYFNLHELGVNRSVNKRWSQFAIPPILWQSTIYREIAFSSKSWAQWDAELVKDVDVRQEILSLPKNIAEELRRSAFHGKSIRETHVLVRMLKGLTIRKLGDLGNKYFSAHDGYGNFWPSTMDWLRNKPAEESAWLLMTKDVVLPERIKSYDQQKNIVAELSTTTGVPYEVPSALQAVACLFAEDSRSENRLSFKKRLFRPATLTYCQENWGGSQILVGDIDFHALPMDSQNSAYFRICAMALRKF